jgi:hypothetical protein
VISKYTIFFPLTFIVTYDHKCSNVYKKPNYDDYLKMEGVQK